MFKDENRHYSLRKLSVGLASVLIGISFASSMNGNNVKADTVNAQASAIETKTSENNKVDANADASKEVANATNSVDSNKITPSQTVLNKQATSNDLLKGTDVKQEQVVDSAQNSVAYQSQNNLLDDLGKQKASTENNQAEAKNQENRLVDQINYKLTNNTSTDNKEDLGQNKVAPDETKQAPTTKSDAEKSIVSPSSAQKINNQSTNHAENNSQTQLNITKNSQQLDQKELATNLTQDNSTQQNEDWGTDPTKYGFHKTSAGWTKLQQGKDYTATAKESQTKLLTGYSDKELSKNSSFEVGDGFNYGIEFNATVDKSLIKKGNTILLSSTAFLYKDGRHFFNNPTGSANVNIISNGVRIGHIVANADSYQNSNSSQLFYELIVDQDQNLAQDLKIHINTGTAVGIDWWGNHWQYLTGTTPNNPAEIKAVTSNSNTYNFKVYVDPNRTSKPFQVTDSNTVGKEFGQNLASGQISVGNLVHNPTDSFTGQNYAYSKVYKITRPQSVNGIEIPNFKSANFVPNFAIGYWMPVLSKEGIIDQVWTHNIQFDAVKLADGLSVQQITDANRNTPVVYSISDDGQSMLIGINIPSTDRENVNNLAGYPYSINDAIQNFKNSVTDTRTLDIDYPDQANDITNRSVNWIKLHNGEPYRIEFTIFGLPTDSQKTIVQTVSDVTLGVKNPKSDMSTLSPSSDLHFDVSVYKQINVKFVDDDDNEKVINTDTFTTSTGTDLTYNIKDSTDKTFNSTTDIAFPSNYVLNQANSVHYGVIQDTNPDIVIHVKHLVKVISGDADLDLYPDIKKALNSDARRTITIVFPAGKQGNNPSSIVQSVHYIRSGKADFTNDTVDETSLTKWNPVASSAYGVTITNGETTFDAVKLPHINGYRTYIIRDKANPAMFMVSFVALPEQNQSISNEPQRPSDNVQSSQKLAQAKQKQPEPIQTRPATKQEDKQTDQIIDHIAYALMHNDSSDTADSFEPAQTDSAPLETADVTQKVTPKPAKPAPIETQVPIETHDLDNYTLTTNDSITDTLVFNNIESNDLTWQINNKNLNNNVPYNLTNTIYKLHLPRFNNYELRLVKRGTTQNSVSFVYMNKSKQLNYVFNLKIQDNKYYLTVCKIDHVNRKMIPIKTYNVISYQYLLDIFDKYFK